MHIYFFYGVLNCTIKEISFRHKI